MSTATAARTGRPWADRELLVAGVRALAGAVLFGLPLLMTMEMWTLGFAMRPERLALLLVLTVPLLTGLAYFGGFRTNVGWRDSLLDAFVAFFLGALAALAVVAAFGIIDEGSSLREIVGIVALESVPASMGAAVARSQLGLSQEKDDVERWEESYTGELCLMVAGGLFFAFNIAPTDEITLITVEQGNPFYALGMAAASLLLLHSFVYTLGFKGSHDPEEDRSKLLAFFRLTLPGYALVLLVCALVLWLFGRLDGIGLDQSLHLTIVLGFPGAIGAAAARLVL